MRRRCARDAAVVAGGWRGWAAPRPDQGAVRGGTREGAARATPATRPPQRLPQGLRPIRAAWHSEAMLKPGDEAPDFVEEACDGKTVRLADLRGQRVLLWFYPRADTPG
jgi:hypothetical protein